MTEIKVTWKVCRATFRILVKLSDSTGSFPALRVVVCAGVNGSLSNRLVNWLLNEIECRYLRSKKKVLLRFCRKIPKPWQTIWTKSIVMHLENKFFS